MAARAGLSASSSMVQLTDEEIVALAHRGSRVATEHLLARYRALVEGKARCYYVSGADHEDVVQEGMIGLFKAIRDYQADRLVRFRSFAEVCVTRQIISAVKSATRRKHLPLNQYVPLTARGDGEVPLAELVADPQVEEPEARLLNRQLTEYLERHGSRELSELEHRAIRSRLEGKSYEQVAAELHCRPKSVDNALQRAKRKIWRVIEAAAD